MINITVQVPDDYCMEPGGVQCNFLYPTGKKFRCRAFDLNGGFIFRDKEYRSHKCKQCKKLGAAHE